jgi:hypothetical protein
MFTCLLSLLYMEERETKLTFTGCSFVRLNQLPKMHTTKLQPALLTTSYLWDRSWMQCNVPMGVAISLYHLLGSETLCARSQQQAPFQGKESTVAAIH